LGIPEGRIPKYILELLNFDEEIELFVDEEAKELHIRSQKPPREQWDNALKKMYKNQDDVLLIDDGLDIDFEDEW